MNTDTLLESLQSGLIELRRTASTENRPHLVKLIDGILAEPPDLRQEAVSIEVPEDLRLRVEALVTFAILDRDFRVETLARDFCRQAGTSKETLSGTVIAGVKTLHAKGVSKNSSVAKDEVLNALGMDLAKFASKAYQAGAVGLAGVARQLAGFAPNEEVRRAAANSLRSENPARSESLGFDNTPALKRVASRFAAASPRCSADQKSLSVNDLPDEKVTGLLRVKRGLLNDPTNPANKVQRQ